MVSPRAILGSAGAHIAVDGVRTLFIEDAVVARLLQGVEVTVGVILASLDALLQMRHLERVHKVSLALVGLMALSGRASEIDQFRRMAVNQNYIPEIINLMYNETPC